MVLLVNRHEGLVGVVVVVCLAGIVEVGGVKRPRDVFAVRALADDDEHVMQFTLVDRSAEPRDRIDDDGVRGGGVQPSTACAIWLLLGPKMGFGSQRSPGSVCSVVSSSRTIQSAASKLLA